MTYRERMSTPMQIAFDRYVTYIAKIDGVLHIYLFGSYAYGEPTEYSDIDLFVVVRDGMNALKTMQHINKGLFDRQFSLDVIVDNLSSFTRLSKSERGTLQSEVHENGVLVYG